MSMSLTQKDWLLISAFLDGRLTDAENTTLESRLNSDADLKAAFLEIQYTRRLLRSLPHKRALRNFTLSAEYAKKRSLRWGLNRFFGWASAASAVALTAIFAWSNLFVFQAKTAAPAPMLAAAPETASMESAALADEATSNIPMIIIWGQPGRGGGGGGNDASAMATGLGGYGGGPAIAEQKLATLVPTESPMIAADLAATADPSTLILGLPEPGSEGETLQPDTNGTRDFAPRMPASTAWMIGLGAGAFIFALLAIFLRKR